MSPLDRLHGVWSGPRGLVVRAVALPLVLAVVTVKLLLIVHRHYPVGDWLFWHYAGYISLSSVWAASCLSAGHRVLKLMQRSTLPALEQVTLAFAVGVLVFFLLMFTGGLLGLLGATFSILLPFAMLLSGASPLLRTARRLSRHLRRARRERRGAAPAWALPIIAAGILAVAMLYLNILTPANVAYDSRWYHLPLAEHYAAEGAIRATPEGWFQAALPHLASLLYTWPFQLPGLSLFGRVELCAHIELVVFLFTLAGIPVLVRSVVPGARAHVAWVALFLFPGIFLYDSSLSCAADHVAALWAVPIYVTMRRALPELELRRCALVGAMLAGAALTKYQTAALIAGPVLVLLVRLGWLTVRRRVGLRSPWPGAAALVIAATVLTAPHWLKNWVFYGDPVYPMLHAHLHDHPWTVDSDHRVEVVFKAQLWEPHGTVLEKLRETLSSGVLEFSVEPHDWWPFHRDVPVFGFLFTVLVVALPFVRRGGRTAVLFLCANVGVAVWYWMSHQDRYLQALVPWMAGAVAATIVLIWRMGWMARVALIPLLAAQVIWGGDVYFFPTHAMIGTQPLKVAADLLSAHFRGEDRRFATFPPWSDAGEHLPPHSKVLVHQSHEHLGLQAASVSDWIGWQGGLSYSRLGNPGAIAQRLREYFVTHLAWLQRNEPEYGRERDSLAGDLAFFQFATLYTVAPTTYGDLTIGEMPPSIPAGPFPDGVVIRACGAAGDYRDGFYRLADLTRPPEAKTPSPAAAPGTSPGCAPGDPLCDGVIGDAEFVVLDPGCDPAFRPGVRGVYKLVTTRGQLQLWVRARAAAPTPPG